MADITHDTTEDGFHEIQLTGKQLVFLFMATTVVSVAIFLCGVMVGRGVSAARGEEAIDAPGSSLSSSASVDQPADTPAGEPPAPPAEDELSYHRRLQGSPDPEPPPAQQGEKPPAVTPPAPAPDTSAAAPNVPTAGQPGVWVVQVTALQNREAAAGIVRRLIGRGYPAFLEMPASGAPAIYRVRIGRYKERREADQIAQRLQREDQFDRPVVTR